MSEPYPIRVLHSLGSLGPGGTETWLMRLLRRRIPGLHMDFVIQSPPGASGRYEAEAIALGSAVHHHAPPSRLIKRAKILGLASRTHALERLLSSGRYDILHVHGSEFIGDALRDAYLAGTPVRVAHCHSTQLARGKRGAEMWVRRIWHRTVNRKRMLRFGTDFLACGRDAGRCMLGDAWDANPRARVVYCGVDLDVFESGMEQTDRRALLRRYELPADAIVIGHAGSMGEVPVKNHGFLVEIFAELARRDRRYHLLMAGDGPGRTKIDAQVRRLGLAERVRMPGVVSDLHLLMMHLFDAHLLPSVLEGLPVVAIEAAAAGLYSVLSDSITDELVALLPSRLEMLPLSSGAARWADAAERAVALRSPPSDGIAVVRASPLTIEKSAEALLSVYRSALARPKNC